MATTAVPLLPPGDRAALLPRQHLAQAHRSMAGPDATVWGLDPHAGQMIIDRRPQPAIKSGRLLPGVVLRVAQKLTQGGVQDDPGHRHRLQLCLAGTGEPVQMIGDAQRQLAQLRRGQRHLVQ